MSNAQVLPTAPRHSRRVLPALVALAALSLAGCEKSQTVDHELTAALIQPVARVELKVEKEASGNRTGEQLYKSLCTTCHAAGVLGAPKTGDTGDWAARLPKGMDTLVASVTNGLGAMPPRAGSSNITDTEIQRAVAYLANQAGGDFTEPPVEAAQ